MNWGPESAASGLSLHLDSDADSSTRTFSDGLARKSRRDGESTYGLAGFGSYIAVANQGKPRRGIASARGAFALSVRSGSPAETSAGMCGMPYTGANFRQAGYGSRLPGLPHPLR